MQAFHNEPRLKRSLVEKMKGHERVYKYRPGLKGFGPGTYVTCFIGCLFNEGLAAKRRNWPRRMGLPVWLSWKAERIFEYCSADYGPTWCSRFLMSIPLGIDLDTVEAESKICLLVNAVYANEMNPSVIDEIGDCLIEWFKSQGSEGLGEAAEEILVSTVKHDECVVSNSRL